MSSENIERLLNPWLFLPYMDEDFYVKTSFGIIITYSKEDAVREAAERKGVIISKEEYNQILAAEDAKAMRKHQEKIAPLEVILNEVYPKFGLALKEPQVHITGDTSKSNIEFLIQPNFINRNDTRYLAGITFNIPRELSEDPKMATAYFAHECSHIELAHTTIYMGLSICQGLSRLLSMQMDKIYATRREWLPPKIDDAMNIGGIILTLVLQIPLAAYGNTIEKVVDYNAKKKGYRDEIEALREIYPLKIFRM